MTDFLGRVGGMAKRCAVVGVAVFGVMLMAQSALAASGDFKVTSSGPNTVSGTYRTPQGDTGTFTLTRTAATGYLGNAIFGNNGTVSPNIGIVANNNSDATTELGGDTYTYVITFTPSPGSAQSLIIEVVGNTSDSSLGNSEPDQVTLTYGGAPFGTSRASLVSNPPVTLHATNGPNLAGQVTPQIRNLCTGYTNIVYSDATMLTACTAMAVGTVIPSGSGYQTLGVCNANPSTCASPTIPSNFRVEVVNATTLTYTSRSNMTGNNKNSSQLGESFREWVGFGVRTNTANVKVAKTWAPKSVAGNSTTVSATIPAGNLVAGTATAASTAQAAGNTTTGTDTAVVQFATSASPVPITATITESPALTNYTQAYACAAPSGGTALSATTIDATGALSIGHADAGKTILCTITNTVKPARVTLMKKSVGGVGGPFSFTLTNTLQTTGTATTATDGTPIQVDGDNATTGLQSYTVDNLSQAVTINESTVPADFIFDAANSVCKDPGGATVSTVSGTTLTINASAVVPDANITCTVVNNKRATLTIKKTAVGGGNEFKFDVTGALTSSFVLNPSGGTNNISSATYPAFINVTPNADITITETKPTGATYNLINVSCSNATGAPTGSTLVTNSPVLVNTTAELGHITGKLAPGADVTCVFTNTRNVNGTVTKHATGGNDTFTMELRRGSTTGTLISTTAIPTTSGIGTVTQSIASSGNDVPFTIQETNIPAGWILTNATCRAVTVPAGVDGLSNVVFSPATNSISGLVDAGTEITCDFYNTRIPKVTIAKESVGGTGTFTFASGTNGLPASLSISTSAASPSVTSAPTTYTVSSISTAATITENATAGWTLASATCRNGGVSGSVVPSALSGSTLTIPASTLAQGNDLTCIFKNEKLPALTLNKIVINDNGGTATASQWTLTATGPSTLSGTTGVNGSVPAGTYTLSESGGPANYDADVKGYSCVKNGGAAVSGNSISLVNGDVAVCSITNNDSNKSNVTVTKTNNTNAPLVSGTNTTYSIVVSNAGPANANNSVITDDNQAGLNCGAAGLPAVTCSASGGASCPSTFTFAALKAGATIPLLPAGGSVTFSLTCRVN